MPNKNPAWKQLELVIARVQKHLAPDAKVRHDHRVRGKSGRLRKLDVTISQRVGAYPIFIVFDCKLHKKPVKLRDVAAFAEQRDDVNATLGVMISNSGFDAGAEAIAAKQGILLQTYRQANDEDWQKILGKDSWAGIVNLTFNDLRATAKFNSEFELNVPFNIALFDEQGQEISHLSEIFWAMWHESNPKPILGEFELHTGHIAHPMFIHNSKHNCYVQVQEFVVTGEMMARQYVINLTLAVGQVLENHESGEAVFSEVVSESFNWEHVVDSQEGAAVTDEEFAGIMSQPNIFNVSDVDSSICLIFRKTDDIKSEGS